MTSKFEDKNYYEILGVSQDASKEAISKAYKEIALIYHPDSNFFSEILGNREEDSQSLEDFQIITNAFSVLTDDAKRAEYDSTLVSFRDWSDGETPDEYFNDMLKKKSISFGMRNLKRERESTVFASVNNVKYFQDFDKSRKSILHFTISDLCRAKLYDFFVFWIQSCGLNIKCHIIHRYIHISS